MSTPANPTAEWIVDVQDMHKTYGRRVRALAGVNLRVGAGEIFGLLGPNGAGKSTLVKILLTIVRANRAGGTMLGSPLGNRGALRHVGYLPENLRLAPHLTARQALEFHAALAKVPRAIRRRRAGELLERVGLRDWTSVRVTKFSKGMLQRLGIAQALMNDPQLVFLDEPTDGLDPIGRRDVREMLVEFREAGKSVFINSHLLSELEMVCDRVAIMVQGKVVRQGTIDELTAHTVTYRITVSSSLASVRNEIEQRGAAIDNNAVVVAGRDAEAVNVIIDLLRQRDILIESVTPRRFSLEEIFVEAVGQNAGAAQAALTATASPPSSKPTEEQN